MEKKVLKKQKNNKKYKINYGRLILIACLVYFAFTFVKQQLVLNDYDVKIDYVSQKIKSEEEEKELLEKEETLAKDSEYLEKIAREKLGLVKPYEKIFIDTNK